MKEVQNAPPQTKKSPSIKKLVLLSVFGVILVVIFAIFIQNLFFTTLQREPGVMLNISHNETSRMTFYASSPAGCRSGKIVATPKYRGNTLNINIKGIRYTGPQEYCDALVDVRGSIDIKADWLNQDGERRVIVSNNRQKTREYKITGHGDSMTYELVQEED